ncbi:MAG: polysaccharide deacetylase family protein, partial [Bacteroidota bacterium]|nr:polysaccharide deacetylase family protein [Bacteroidota bacterium]
DQYGRYAHTNSIAYQSGFLRRPLVNEWMQAFTNLLKQKFPQLKVRDLTTDFRFIPTYDIDEAYRYHYQPLWKNILGFFRDLLRGDFTAVVERGNVYTGNMPDPYDSFDWLDELHQSYSCQPIYFFLTLLKKGQYDKNLLSGNRGIRELYQRLSERYATGLHPSWQSGSEPGLLQKERDVLNQITGQSILRSRNHYLRFTIPQTYRNLIGLGIQEEYSMAYGNANGFRASYAKPFLWYDLENEKETGLELHPFCFMEACSFFNQGLTASEAGEELQYFHDKVRSVGGELITLFHNHFLTTQPEWLPWRNMYARFLQENFAGVKRSENQTASASAS